MVMQAGHRLGPYEIVAPIGAGGMGEVYKARDTRLDRTVAIKVLPAQLSATPQLKLRFDREARAISSLSHPNICVLHDVGSADGIDFLVMELLDGETLAEQLARGPLPLDQTLRYSREILAALERAHRAGVIHRDLKPGNVMITRNGVKLLDFGLAKAAAPAIAPDALTSLVTSQKPITEQGTILGTVQYMSPEQLEAKEADARSDIFAFGTVLYEMLTGQLAFGGKSKASVIASILAGQPPPITQLQPSTPPPLDRVVRICLEKDPDQRWQSAHDLKLEIERIAATSGVEEVRQAEAPRRRFLPLAAAITLLLLALAYVVYDRLKLHQPLPTMRLTIEPPEGSRFNPGESAVALSPDGSRMVLRVDGISRRGLMVRSLHSSDYQLLPGTQDAYDACWSPDGRQIAFFDRGKLRRIDAKGGSSRLIAEAGDSRGVSWGAGEVIVYSPSGSGPLHKVSAAGGASKAVTKLDVSRRETGHWSPAFLPDGKRFLYHARSENPDFNGIWVGSVDGSVAKRVLDVDSPAVFAGGHIFYRAGDVLYAQAFDTAKLEARDEPVVIGTGLEVGRGQRFSAASEIVTYHVAPPIQMRQMWSFNRGTRSQTNLPNVYGRNLDLARDGSRIALERVDETTRTADIWTYDIKRGTTTRISSDAASDTGPVWSPDGKRIVYASYRSGVVSIFQRSSSGTGPEVALFKTSADSMVKQSWWGLEVVDWSPDASTLLVELFATSGTDLTLFRPGVDRHPVPYIVTSFDERSGRFSRDGKWVAYQSNESGAWELYVQPYPATGAKWQISTGGGDSPRWRADGREILFTSPDNRIMAVSVTTDGENLSLGQAVAIGEGGSTDIVVTADGETVFGSSREEDMSVPLHVVANWRALVDK